MVSLLLIPTFSLPITVNFPVGSIEHTVITYLDVRVECELEVLLYGGSADCGEPEHLHQVFKDLLLRKIVTFSTYDLKLELVKYTQVEKLFNALIKEKGNRLKKFMDTFGLSPEKVKYMIWERLNTLSYLKVKFGMKFNKSDPLFQTWYSSELQKYRVKDIWEKAFSRVFHVKSGQ